MGAQPPESESQPQPENSAREAQIVEIGKLLGELRDDLISRVIELTLNVDQGLKWQDQEQPKHRIRRLIELALGTPVHPQLEDTISRLFQVALEVKQQVQKRREFRINRLIDLASPFIIAASKNPSVIHRDHDQRKNAKHTDTVIQKATLELENKLRKRFLKEWTVKEFLGKAKKELVRNAIDVAKREAKLAERFQQKLEEDGVLEKAASTSKADDYKASPADTLALLRAVEALPKDLREPFQLNHFFKQTVRQLGAALKLSIGTAQRRLEEARTELRNILPNPYEP